MFSPFFFFVWSTLASLLNCLHWNNLLHTDECKTFSVHIGSMQGKCNSTVSVHPWSTVSSGQTLNLRGWEGGGASCEWQVILESMNYFLWCIFEHISLYFDKNLSFYAKWVKLDRSDFLHFCYALIDFSGCINKSASYGITLTARSLFLHHESREKTHPTHRLGTLPAN